MSPTFTVLDMMVMDMMVIVAVDVSHNRSAAVGNRDIVVEIAGNLLRRL